MGMVPTLEPLLPNFNVAHRTARHQGALGRWQCVSRCGSGEDDPLRRTVARAIDPKVPIYDVKTLDRRLADNLARPRFYSTATLTLSLLALQQKGEIGIRLAIGASRQGVRLMVLQESLLPLTASIGAGIVLAIFASRFLGSLLEGALRPAVFGYAAVSAFLLLTGVVTAWISAAKILPNDPASCLLAK